MIIKLNESEYTTGNFGRNVSKPYKVIAGVDLESDDYFDLLDKEDFNEEAFMDEQQEAFENKLIELGYDFYEKPCVIRFLDKPDNLYIMTLDDAVQCLSIKDGANLVQFDDGKIGVVAYYNDYDNNALEIIRNATEEDFEAEDSGEDLIESFDEYDDFGASESVFEKIDSKDVMDSDGFYTDYTLYHNIVDDTYVCVFGDNEIYTPEDGYYDAEFDTLEEAKDWFENYRGFDEDEEY